MRRKFFKTRTKSIRKKEVSNLNELLPEKEKSLSIISMDSVEPEAVEWLWYPYIPFGKVTILQGDPGCGKTMLALDIAARLSKGEPLPFSDVTLPPMTVLYQTAEDGMSDTIKPRLLEARANCENIKFIDESQDPLCFTDARIEAAILQTGARLLILDPLSAYIGGDISLNAANEVRSTFRPLYEAASRTRCAVLIIAHMNKSVGGSALYRTNGSIDVSGAVRSILSVGKRRGEKTERIAVHVKSNLAQAGKALIYELTDHVEWKRQEEIDPDGLFLSGGSDRRTKKDEAELELVTMLVEEDIPATEIEEHFGEMAISFRTVNEAKKSLGIRSYRKGNQSFWALTDDLKRQLCNNAACTEER